MPPCRLGMREASAHTPVSGKPFLVSLTVTPSYKPVMVCSSFVSWYTQSVNSFTWTTSRSSVPFLPVVGEGRAGNVFGGTCSAVRVSVPWAHLRSRPP